ncbi:MAG: UDP-N-acetylglucosamine 2-epimerase (non-hydrolyzing), partial [Lentisphaeraceae bacterium]|nr:UDP-N-acetylglucosamine 2-epimerase (non-hydrolyzing) [Lentisphaeraceae bacterium]
MKIMTVVGARPQFVKAAVVSREIQKRNEVEEFLLHTGQHYDDNMSKSFFDDLCIPEPVVNLNVRSGPHGRQTAKILMAVEEQILVCKPDILLVYGDTNSTLAAALAASKLHVPIAHVEAGLRSFNRRMPEEVNRVMTDHISSHLFAPSPLSVENFKIEGFTQGVGRSGDVMFDAVLFYRQLAVKQSQILDKFKLRGERFALVTIHRAENTDDPQNLKEIFSGLQAIRSQGVRIVIPLHPRTAKIVTEGHYLTEGLEIIEPLAYFDILQLLDSAAAVVTDSG